MMTENMKTPAAEFIRAKIVQAFEELAEETAKMQFTEDEAAGLPMTIFDAENYLLNCWKAYTDDTPGR